jgi:acetylornithine deacetylase
MSLELSQELLREVDAAIDEQRLVETLRELIRRRSVNPFDEAPSEDQGEEAVAKYMAGRLAELQIQHELREFGSRRSNLIGKLGPASEPASLMLAGHMDTVRTTGYQNAYAAEVGDGYVYGRGACDMKGALACYLEVVEVLRAVAPPMRGPLFIVGVADEEHRMIGAREIGASGPSADGVIVGEPTELNICPASKGRVSAFMVTRGRAAHSGVPETGINAINHMGYVLRSLERYSTNLLERGDPHPLLGNPRVNAGVITGGTQANIVPDECRLEVDRRTLPGETTEVVYDELEAVLEEAGTETEDFRVSLTEPSLLVPPNETETNHPLVAALEDMFGKRREDKRFMAGSDAAYYGSPAVICGPGSIEQAHTTNEYVPITDLVSATRIYLRTVLALV